MGLAFASDDAGADSMIHIIPFHPKKLRRDMESFDEDSPLHYSNRSPWPTINLVKAEDIDHAKVIWRDQRVGHSNSNSSSIEREREDVEDEELEEAELHFSEMKGRNEEQLEALGKDKLASIWKDLTNRKR